jgi:prephenate dehydrogenase
MALIERPSAGGVNGLNITIVGLGLMGGSIAKALRRGSGARVTALGRRAEAMQAALDEGVADRACTDPAEALRYADLTVVCLNPGAAVQFIVENMKFFKPGSVITDICGVKRPIVDGILPFLRPDVDFVPAHPMAGRERSGYRYSDASLFDCCNYLMTPLAKNKPQSLDLGKRLAGALGAGNIVLTDPEEHDSMIAYTSQLPHALAVAYVLMAGKRDPLPFAAGSYRDVSRVAAINAGMWSELFLVNGKALLGEIEGLMAGMENIRKYIEAGDRQGLVEALSAAAKAKEERL